LLILDINGVSKIIFGMDIVNLTGITTNPGVGFFIQGNHVPGPIAVPPDVRLDKPHDMSTYPKGSHVPSPTATPPDVHLQQRTNMSPHPKDIHVPWPIVAPPDVHI